MPHPDELHFDSVPETWLRLTLDILARNQELLGHDDGPLARFLDGQSQYLKGQYDEWARTGIISNHVFLSALNYLRAFRDSYTREWAHARDDHYDHMNACVRFAVDELERYVSV